MSVSLSFLKTKPSILATFAILCAATTVFLLWESRHLYGFFSFAFRDSGSNLMLVKLVNDGQKPITDFGYAYGLLSVIFSQIWLNLFGITPTAFLAAEYLIILVFCYWLARMHAAIDGTYVHLLLLLALLPFVVPTAAISHTHVLEPVFLLAAIALWVEGTPRWALLSCTLCLFIKPSMAYFLGLLLVMELLRTHKPRDGSGWKSLLRGLGPSILAAIIVGVFLGVYYGWAPLVASLTGQTGRKIYSINHYGVLGYGRGFFWSTNWKYYLGQPAGFWIFSVLAICAAGFQTMVSRFATGKPLSKSEQLIVTIAILMLAFHVFCYGGPESWLYYAFLLVLFWMAVLDFRRFRWLLAIALPLAALTTLVSFKGRLQYWRTSVASPLTLGLTTEPETLSEWSAIRALVRGSHATILSYAGASAIFFPDLDTAPRLFLERGQTQPRELEATLATLQRADYVVWPVGLPYLNYFEWPVIGDELKKFHIVSKSERFTVLKR